MGDFISKTDMKTEMDISSSTDDNMMDSIADSIENVWDQLTNRTWASATYFEKYKPDSSLIFLKQYPVTKLFFVGINTADVVNISNSNTLLYATITRIGDILYFDYSGSENTIDLTTYDTITKVADQINTLGDGWSASAVNGYESLNSKYIIEGYTIDCINTTDSLQIVSDFSSGYTLDDDAGVIHTANIVNPAWVKYTAGYSTIPDGIKQVLTRQASHWYRQAKNKSWEYSTIDKMEGGSVSFAKSKEFNLLPEFVGFAKRNRAINV